MEEEWTKYQEEGAKKVICEDGFDIDNLRYVAGVDISFNKKDPSLACGYLTVVDYNSMNIVYEDHQNIKLTLPYVSGYLAFREMPVYTALLNKLKEDMPKFYPDVVMIDGSGILHHRCFGSASQLGLIHDIPTIGCAKTLLCVDGLDERDIKALFKANCDKKGDSIELVGDSGKVYGVALKGANDSDNPLYISIGHKMSIESAIIITTRLCKFRIPEPIRNSDIKSKLFL